MICFVFWWNPIFRIFSLEMSNILEMHSDQKVCQMLNKTQQKTYLEVILKTTKNMNYGKLNFPITYSLTKKEDNENLAQRFKMILENTYTKKTYKNILIYPIALIIFFLSYAIVFQPYSEPTPDQYEGDIILTIDENSYFVKEKEGYTLYSAEGILVEHIAIIPDDLKQLKVYNDTRSEH